MIHDEDGYRLLCSGTILDEYHIITGQVFSKRIEITHQIHVRKFVEQLAWEWVPCMGLFLTPTGFSGLVRTLWMSKMSPSKSPSSRHILFKFSDVNLGSDFYPFWKNLTCINWKTNGVRSGNKMQNVVLPSHFLGLIFVIYTFNNPPIYFGYWFYVTILLFKDYSLAE